MASKDAEVEFSGNKQRVRVKPVNWNGSTLSVTAPGIMAYIDAYFLLLFFFLNEMVLKILWWYVGYLATKSLLNRNGTNLSDFYGH